MICIANAEDYEEECVPRGCGDDPEKDVVRLMLDECSPRIDCPYCGRRCPGYDTAAAKPKVWRALDWGGS